VSFAFKRDSRFDLYTSEIGALERFISFQTVAEMRLGARLSRWGPRRQQLLEELLATLQVVAYTDALASRWATIMEAARLSGRRLESGDAWIAATASLLDVPLITHDRDFVGISTAALRVICHG
jgi:predicted nucleic acid-binding protein